MTTLTDTTTSTPGTGEMPDARTMSGVQETSGAQEQKLARLIIDTLNLEADPATIDPDAPLYGEGLGLDSIDMLEIALAVSQTYGVKLRSDDKNNGEIFSSLASLNRYIQQNIGHHHGAPHEPGQDDVGQK